MLNILAPDRHRPLYLLFWSSQRAVFLINSPPHVIRCGLIISNRGRAYPEVTPANLPSSLSLVIPLALVFSTSPLVLVLGTG